jgi:arylformamidase
MAMRIHDLTMPIAPGHVRWPAETSVRGDTSKGDLYQVTTLKVSCHGFTHVDAKRHYFTDAPAIEATALEDVVGDCAVIDLLDAQPNEAIAPEKIAPRFDHVQPRDMILFKSGWDRHRDFRTKEFWLDAPYLTREAALLLKDKGVRTVAYDFPQDYCIRLLLSGEARPIEEHVTHDILLRAADRNTRRAVIAAVFTTYSIICTPARSRMSCVTCSSIGRASPDNSSRMQ